MRDHPDHHSYRRFTRKGEIDKSINSLLGLVEGIAIDSQINDQEVQFLQIWLDDHQIRSDKHPFNELLPVVAQALADGVFTRDEKEDVSWLCQKLKSSEYFDFATADMQKLHAVLAGIASDCIISVVELRELSSWLQEHEHLRTCWPYDEVDSLVTSVLADKRIDSAEHKVLMEFFGEFVSILDSNTIVNPRILEERTITGICAVCPEIEFSGSVFCITGASHKYSQKQFEEAVTQLGGIPSGSVSQSVNYLVIGSDGNPCWAYACYGRKVEKAVELRRKGHPIVIVHENDFHDAVADQ